MDFQFPSPKLLILVSRDWGNILGIQYYTGGVTYYRLLALYTYILGNILYTFSYEYIGVGATFWVVK